LPVSSASMTTAVNGEICAFIVDGIYFLKLYMNQSL
jgi:hypothetical protein